ncbi:hypothetical protein B296_00009831 [Ensete ventricosum]|uniref:Uncharacterized protein n=1 Tax=Ensete ventricosum TaxID=4639 RepID=A0A427AP51_ENSVE|nr:hypothetical protein B296_00009831 [Ensete ventricosum]
MASHVAHVPMHGKHAKQRAVHAPQRRELVEHVLYHTEALILKLLKPWDTALHLEHTGFVLLASTTPAISLPSSLTASRPAFAAPVCTSRPGK